MIIIAVIASNPEMIIPRNSQSTARQSHIRGARHAQKETQEASLKRTQNPKTLDALMHVPTQVRPRAQSDVTQLNLRRTAMDSYVVASRFACFIKKGGWCARYPPEPIPRSPQ